MARALKPDPKLAALQDSGTVNAHAQDVQDPAFIGSEFFDARDLVQVRYEMLRRVRTEGHAIAETAARFGVSRPTFYKVQAGFDQQGLVGLLPAKRGPRGAHKITKEVMRFIEEARVADDALSAQALVERIAAQFGLVVHRRTVERALGGTKKNGNDQPPTAPPDAGALAECYEELRQEVVERSGFARMARGRALLMFKGMAVWMKHMAETDSRRASPVVTRNTSGLSVGIEQNLVNIMAAMV